MLKEAKPPSISIPTENHIPLEPLYRQSMPNRLLFVVACCDLTSAKVSIGERPEFSARASGVASKAAAKARIAYCSIVEISSAALETASEHEISAAPPP
ncbi:hypothetical protein BC938DRAFT_483325 [Jimgerdemannia flammicorona]|uniref:Uncharacterized protein n=1 Tax=Jimgerdemannia flammicorona TaxID=994334 RepID=A0A433QC55_9FUNG|nr:hypothetical protein BC938DRAFT_483325 [Jimgerdemannia flammicorona]